MAESQRLLIFSSYDSLQNDNWAFSSVILELLVHLQRFIDASRQTRIFMQELKKHKNEQKKHFFWKTFGSFFFDLFN